MRLRNDSTTYPALPELTFRGMLLGVLITVIFTASNVYLGLKVGLTFASSIPAAVISMAILRMFKDSNILENNIVQTQVSVAGTLSAIIFVLPGLLMIGYWQGFPFWQTLILCSCGGSLGVLFTIPLRRAMVVNSDLPYPEGRAAAEILKVGSNLRKDKENADGQKQDSGLKNIISGTIVASIFSLCSNGFHVLSSEYSYWIMLGKTAVTQLPIGFSMALLGAGYLIGIAGGVSMLIGTFIGWGVFVPYLTSISVPADGQSMAAFAKSLWTAKIRFIGAGCIGIAAVWTLLSLFGAIIDGVKMSIAAIRNSRTDIDEARHHTDIDLSPKAIGIVFVISIIGLLCIFYSFISDANLSVELTFIYIIVGVLVAVIIGFFIAAACGYMAGLIGTSASPISGISIIGVIIASVIVMYIGASFDIFTSPAGIKFATALSIFITSVIMTVACISNDNLQDLKTGYLVGATPWKQQVALIFGTIVGSFAIAPVLNLLYQAYGFPGALPRAGMDVAHALAAPQATLLTTIAQGIFNNSLDWYYIIIGIIIGIIAIIVDILLRKTTKVLTLPPLAMGLGLYLPPTLVMALTVGAFLGYFTHKYLKMKAARFYLGQEEEYVKNCTQHGILFASGLIVGESILGVIVAMIIVFSVSLGGSENPLALVGSDFENTANVLGLIAFFAVIVIFVWQIVGSKFRTKN